ncbi:unnamed protein product [Arctogadus glacialis]
MPPKKRHLTGVMGQMCRVCPAGQKDAEVPPEGEQSTLDAPCSDSSIPRVPAAPSLWRPGCALSNLCGVEGWDGEGGGEGIQKKKKKKHPPPQGLLSGRLTGTHPK